MWQQWLNLIIGLWIVLSGYMNLGPAENTTNLTVAGIAIVVLALWGALEYRSKYVTKSYDQTHSHA